MQVRLPCNTRLDISQFQSPKVRGSPFPNDILRIRSSAEGEPQNSSIDVLELDKARLSLGFAALEL